MSYIEEDGDEVFTQMGQCRIWPCGAVPLVKSGPDSHGDYWWVCPNGHGSYGPAKRTDPATYPPLNQRGKAEAIGRAGSEPDGVERDPASTPPNSECQREDCSEVKR